MIKSALFFSLVFLSISLTFGQGNNGYKKYEDLKYLMHYGWFDGAICKVNLIETIYQGKEVYYAKATAETIGLTDKLYNVHDEYSSYFDKTTLLPYLAIRKIKEGRYNYYDEVTYDHENQKIFSLKSGEHMFPDTLPKMVFDMVSAFYFARENLFDDVKVGQYLTLNTYFSGNYFLLQVRYIGLKEIKVKFGKILCKEFRPVVEPGRVFDTQEDVKFWVSDDKNHVPIRAQVDLFIGSFKADLVEYSGLKEKLKFIEE